MIEEPRDRITCPKCGRVSHNPNDVAKRFCPAEGCGWHDEMTGVFLGQLLCPDRHCIIAACMTSPGEMDGAKVKLLGLFAAGRLNPWCGICGSTKLHWELRITPFKTMEEAMPHLREETRRNMAAHKHFAQSFKPN